MQLVLLPDLPSTTPLPCGLPLRPYAARLSAAMGEVLAAWCDSCTARGSDALSQCSTCGCRHHMSKSVYWSGTSRFALPSFYLSCAVQIASGASGGSLTLVQVSNELVRRPFCIVMVRAVLSNHLRVLVWTICLLLPTSARLLVVVLQLAIDASKFVMLADGCRVLCHAVLNHKGLVLRAAAVGETPECHCCWGCVRGCNHRGGVSARPGRPTAQHGACVHWLLTEAQVTIATTTSCTPKSNTAVFCSKGVVTEVFAIVCSDLLRSRYTLSDVTPGIRWPLLGRSWHGRASCPRSATA